MNATANTIIARRADVGSTIDELRLRSTQRSSTSVVITRPRNTTTETSAICSRRRWIAASVTCPSARRPATRSSRRICSRRSSSVVPIESPRSRATALSAGTGLGLEREPRDVRRRSARIVVGDPAEDRLVHAEDRVAVAVGGRPGVRQTGPGRRLTLAEVLVHVRIDGRVRETRDGDRRIRVHVEVLHLDAYAGERVGIDVPVRAAVARTDPREVVVRPRDEAAVGEAE